MVESLERGLEMDEVGVCTLLRWAGSITRRGRLGCRLDEEANGVDCVEDRDGADKNADREGMGGGIDP